MTTVVEQGRALRARQVSSKELVTDALRKARESELNAFLTFTEEQALQLSEDRDRELGQGIDRGPLHGIPIAHKDCLFTKGVRTTWGSKIFADFVPDRDAYAVRALHDAGAVSIGKTGLHELTYGMTSNNPHYGPVRNPHDPARVAGGSSGGSGVAVAAGIVALATGTDTGGSIRIPASFCGVAGFKPTFDRISREGCFPLGLTLDHIGPMARTVRDAADAFAALTGAAPAFEPSSLRGLRIGLPAKFFFERIDGAVKESVRHAARLAEEAGAIVTEIRSGDGEALNTIGRIVQLAEAAAVLGKYAHRREDFGSDVLALIDQGRMIPATEYLNAQRVRRILVEDFSAAWKDCDCLLMPATPTAAPLIGQTNVAIEGVSEDVRMAGTRLTRPINVLGWPAVSLPYGRTVEGLPIGLQLVGPPGSDEKLLARAASLEVVLSP